MRPTAICDRCSRCAHVFARLAAIACVLLVCVAAAHADTVELAPSADTTLYSDDGGFSNGVGEHVFAGTNGMGDERRALIAFDVAAGVPAGSTITDVQLVLNMSRTLTGDTTVSLHHVGAAWGEGASDASGEEGGGAAAQPGDATWTYRIYDTATWTNAGGDFDATALASTVVGALGTYSWSSAALTAEVQAFLDTPAGNHGWLLLGEGGGTAKRFDSVQNATATVRPKLVVTFTPSSATGACCSADGSCGLVLDSSHTSACASGTYQGVSSVCAPNPCPQPPEACCLPDSSGTCMDLDAAACGAQSGELQGAGSACSEVTCPAVLTPFVDELPLLHVAEPTSGTEGGAADYTLAMTELLAKLHRDLPDTTVWGFDDGSGATFPGPTIEAFRDEPVRVTWHNDLRELGSGALRTEHSLTVDTCLHGAQDGPPVAIVHLHGAHVPARFDGFPDDAYPPGESAEYAYPNAQPAATLWYHDHALGVTRLNMYMGLSGMYVLRDAQESALALPAGPYEIPLVIQDRSFRGDGSLIYPEMFQEHFFGRSILVNGKVAPYLDVDRGKYRFRVLNGCNARTLRLSLDDGASFQVIGSDGGLLPEPVTVSFITLGAAERAELVIDFSGYAAGSEIVLQNDAPAPYPGTPGVGVVPEVMKFVVGSASGFTGPLPASLASVPPIDEADSSRSRDFVLQAEPPSAASCGHRMWLINGLSWDEVSEYPRLGTTEIWRFVNPSGVSHPMHMHLVQFQILDRQAVEVDGDTITALGSPSPPAPEEAGWKDTVMVPPGEAVRVIATFTDYTGAFAYHCHMVEHEDHAMMRRFVTTTVCGDGVLGQPAEECDDGGESASCDDDCSFAACGDGVLNASAGELCDDGSGGAGACDAPCPDAGPADDGGVAEPDAGEHEDAGLGSGGSGSKPDAGSMAGDDAGASLADAGRSHGGDDQAGGCGCRVGARGSPRGVSASSLFGVACATWLARARRRRTRGGAARFAPPHVEPGSARDRRVADAIAAAHVVGAAG